MCGKHGIHSRGNQLPASLRAQTILLILISPCRPRFHTTFTFQSSNFDAKSLFRHNRSVTGLLEPPRGIVYRKKLLRRKLWVNYRVLGRRLVEERRTFQRVQILEPTLYQSLGEPGFGTQSLILFA